MRRSTTLVVTALAALSGGPGCEKEAAPPPRQPAPVTAQTGTPPTAAQPAPSHPTASPSTPAATGPAVTVGGVAFPLPESWKQVPPSNPMRLAEVQVPAPSGDPAQASVVTFSTAGGDVGANIERWAGQVRDASGQPSKPIVQTRTIQGLRVHIAEMAGTYTGMNEPPRGGWTLRGAVIEAPGGLLFVKMTGPADSMAAAAAGFTSLIDGLHSR